MPHDEVKPGVMPTSFFPKYEGKLAIPTMGKPEAPVPKVSKIDQAITYMKGRGGVATVGELRKALDIISPAHPNAYLNPAVKDGRMHKTDSGFALGPTTVTGFDPASANGDHASQVEVTDSVVTDIKLFAPERLQAGVEETTFGPLTTKPIDALDATLAERGSRYGKFVTHALVTQRLKSVMAQEIAARQPLPLQPDQQEALDMIAHKIGRIINGDPNYADSWTDIAGYAKRVADRLEGKVQ